jgi:hypothetical protein
MLSPTQLLMKPLLLSCLNNENGLSFSTQSLSYLISHGVKIQQKFKDDSIRFPNGQFNKSNLESH